MLFELSFKKRLQQLFCNHNYFAVAVTNDYREPDERKNERVAIYKCEDCEHVQITKQLHNS